MYPRSKKLTMDSALLQEHHLLHLGEADDLEPEEESSLGEVPRVEVNSIVPRRLLLIYHRRRYFITTMFLVSEYAPDLSL